MMDLPLSRFGFPVAAYFAVLFACGSRYAATRFGFGIIFLFGV
jgi:hypothetical protein